MSVMRTRPGAPEIFKAITPSDVTLLAGSQIVRVIRTGRTASAETVQLNVAAGATNGIAAGEVTGGFGNRTISFAAGQIWKDVTISTTNTALRTMHLSLTGLPSGAQIGTLSIAGVTQAVRPA